MDTRRSVAARLPTVLAASLSFALFCVATPVVRADLDEASRKLFHDNCVECHGAESQEAGVRVDQLLRENGTTADLDRWKRVLEVLENGTMPPDDAMTPTGRQRLAMIRNTRSELIRLEKEVRRTRYGGRSRRLTVTEYEHTMQSLFGVDARFNDLLPEDPISEAGYRNSIDRLGLSSLQVEAYLDSARRAIDRYVQFGDLSEDPLYYQIEFEDLYYSTSKRYETRERAPKPLLWQEFRERHSGTENKETRYVDPLGPSLPGAFTDLEPMRAAIPKLHQQYVALPKRLYLGDYVIRVRAAGTADRDGRYPRMRVEAGITLGDGCSIDKRVVGEVDVDASSENPDVYEFRIRLEDVPTKGLLDETDSFDRLSVFDMDQIFISNITCDQHAIFDLGRGAYAGPAKGSESIAGSLAEMAADRVCFLHLDSIEVEMIPGPRRTRQASAANDESDRRAAGTKPENYKWQVPVDVLMQDREPQALFAKEFLGRFMAEAYRRPVSERELSVKLGLFRRLRQEGESFEAGLKETLAAVLVSPSFLFLTLDRIENGDEGETARAFALASRLAYLVWSSPPDAELLGHAADGSLLDSDVLRRQTSRMLNHARVRRSLDEFCNGWLRLDKLKNVVVDRSRYPFYDADLAELSGKETRAYFAEVFTSGASALDLLDSRYVVVNDRLARHYGISGISTGDLRRVPLPPSSVRGGILTHASLQTLNSDGANSHPIRRGAWLLDRILDQPPPPPPPNVPPLEDGDPASESLSRRERILKHREPGGCMACHRKIDPWGLAMENLDAVGQWRDEVHELKDDGDHSMPVDAKTILPDGREIEGVVQLKRVLREDYNDQFARSLVSNVVTFATGRHPGFLEREEVGRLTKSFVDSGYRLKELILAVVESPIFMERRNRHRISTTKLRKQLNAE